MNAPSPGQAAYEAFFTHFGMPHDWAASDGSTRAAWEAAAQAAIDAFVQQPAPLIVNLDREITEAEAAELRERLNAAVNRPWAERAAEILTEGHP